MQKLGTIAVLLFLFSTVSFSQMFSVPDGATMVADTLGAQDLPKVAASPDGSSYVSWFDLRGKGYALYIQRLNPEGEPLFAPQGLLVSGHPQATSLSDYDLKCDKEGNAIIAFTDYRTGGPDIFVYKISPKGEFLWENDGIKISQSTGNYQAQPKIAITEDGCATVAWTNSQGNQRYAIQRLSSDGKKLWGDAPTYYGHREASFEVPQPVPSDSNSVIVIYNVVTGNFPQLNVAIAAEKFSAQGRAIWGHGLVYVQSLGHVMPFTPPSVRADGENGAVIAWHDDRDTDNKMVAYAQKLNSNGTFEFPLNGAEVASVEGNSYNPIAVRLGVTREVMVNWKGTDRSQSESGLFAQILDERGGKKLGDGGMAVIPVSQQSITDYNLTSIGNAAYIASVSGSHPNKDGYLDLNVLTSAGIMNWQGAGLIAENEGAKGRLEMVTAPFNSCLMAFTVGLKKGESVWAAKRNYNGNPGGIFSPVNLIDFRAWNMGPEVVISWATNHEEGKWKFKLERRTVDSDWTTVKEVEGTGGFYTVANYEFTDKAPGDTRMVYRLIAKGPKGDEIAWDLGQVIDTSYPIVK
ncbi:MAG: hypothetical protein HBSAPP04_26250 [Ignavibacteriaceae bacterium]|nr:MAG: hypothetical protein HBSAPP04_26250 [Ignavibacteriaceae bacterium]